MRIIQILRSLIRLIREILQDEREKNELNGLYVDNETPRVFGTKIRRSR